MLSKVEEFLLILMIFGLMIGIGCSLDFNSIKKLKDKKKEFFIGLILQYISMPLLATILISLIDTSPVNKFVFILIACMPGGTTSNMFSFLSKGNVTLSIALTSITSLFALFMSPFLVSCFYNANDFIVPYKNIFITLAFALTPIAIGLALRKINLKLAEFVEVWGTRLGYLSILIMIGIWLPKLVKIFQEKNPTLFMMAGILSLSGMTISFFISHLVKLKREEKISLSFETGIQNAPLAFAIVTLTYANTQYESITWLPLVYGALSVGNGILFTAIFKLSRK